MTPTRAQVEDVPPLVLRQPGDAAASAAAVELLGGDGGPGTQILVLSDLAADPADPPPAAALVAAGLAGTVELRRVAIGSAVPDGQVFARLVAGVADCLRAVGCRRMVVAPAVVDRSRRALLLAVGFQDTADGGLELAL